MSDRPGRVTRIKDAASARWTAARERWFWLDHIVVAYQRFSENNGNLYAGALTFFSFLAIFPLVLLGVAITGFVLRSNPDLQQRLLDKITSTVPGGFGDTLKSSINSAIRERTSVGIVGLVGVLLTGLGWIANLQAAVNAVWGTTPAKRNPVMAKVYQLMVLCGLGLGVLVSLGLTVVGTALTHQILRAIHADHIAGVPILVTVFGLLLAVVGDMLVVGWMLVRLPKVELPFRVLVRGALLAAIGLEILKIVGTAYIAKVTHSPTAGIFGSVIGILVWMNLVFRYLLFATAWTATAWRRPQPAPEIAAELGRRPIAAEPPAPSHGLSPAGVAASLLGTGAAIGGGAVAWLTARRRK